MPGDPKSNIGCGYWPNNSLANLVPGALCVCRGSKSAGKGFNPATRPETWEWDYSQTEDHQENLWKVSNVGNKAKMQAAE